MVDDLLIRRLIASEQYGSLKRLTPSFNLFALLGDALREPAWSRIFAGLLDSTLPHGLGDAPLRLWLRHIYAEQDGNGAPIPASFLRLPAGAVVRTSVEFSTPAGRRIDILIRVLDSKHRVAAVIGVENKLDSPEQPSQIADYQAALDESFPGVRRLILYLTPDGRSPETANSTSTCQCHLASYKTIVKLCETLDSDALGDVQLLLRSIQREIRSAALQENDMQAKAKSLVEKLWSDPEHRRAMQLIVECVPTQRKTWESQLQSRLKKVATANRMEIDDDCFEYYPAKSASPREIKVYCGGATAETSERMGFYLCYMLHCTDQVPDAGSEFCVRLVAWCKSRRARDRIAKLNLSERLPPSRPLKSWSQWENIWTGEPYVLRGSDAKDVEGLSSLFSQATKATFKRVNSALRESLR